MWKYPDNVLIIVHLLAPLLSVMRFPHFAVFHGTLLSINTPLLWIASRKSYPLPGENILILEIERLGMDMHRLLAYISTDMMSMRLSCIEIDTHSKNIAGLQTNWDCLVRCNTSLSYMYTSLLCWTRVRFFTIQLHLNSSL